MPYSYSIIWVYNKFNCLFYKLRYFWEFVLVKYAKKCKNHLTSSSESQLTSSLISMCILESILCITLCRSAHSILFPSLFFYWISIIVWKVEIKNAKKRKQNHLNIMLNGKRYWLLTFGEFHFMHHFLCVCMHASYKEKKDREGKG